MNDDAERNSTGGTKRILANLSWSASEQIVRMALGFGVSVTLARYLGPELFGTYSFLQSDIAMCSTLIPLAADQIVQRRLITQPGRAQATLGAALALRAAGLVMASLAAVLVILAIKSDMAGVWVLATVAVAALAFQSLDLIVVWFQSQMNMRAVFWARTPSFALITGVRVLMVITSASFFTLVWSIAADAALTALGLLAAFRFFGRFAPLMRFSPADARGLVAESWPVFLSLVMAGIYYRLDALMISWLVGDREVGIYGVAAKISELWNFLPAVFLGVVTPVLIAARQASVEKYQALLRQFFGLLGAAGLFISLVMSVFATPICVLLFGSQYATSGGVLAIHTWSTVPVFLGLASNCALIIEGLTKTVMLRTTVGLVVNATLNALLIPEYGAQGAAFANVMAFALGTLSPFLLLQSRAHVRLMLGSVAPGNLVEVARAAIAQVRNLTGV